MHKIRKAAIQKNVMLIPLFSSVQFLVLSSLAILFYPEKYLIFEDPLSGLGFTMVNGQSNFVSSLLFNFSMLVLGIGLVLFFLTYMRFFSSPFISQWSSTSGGILGTLSGLAMCGAALTPGDINFDLHVMFAPITFLFGTITFFLFGIAIMFNSDFENQSGLFAFGFVFLASVSIFVMIVGPPYSTTTGLILQTVLQKILIIVECFVLFVLSYRSLSHLKSESSSIPIKTL